MWLSSVVDENIRIIITIPDIIHRHDF
jgi:hypothetical protein